MATKLIHFIEIEEFKKVLKAEKDKNFKLAYALAFGSGLRISEIVGPAKNSNQEIKPLTLEQVDLQRHTIKVLGKGSKERITMTSPWLNENNLKLLPLKINRRTLQDRFRKLCKKTLGRYLNFHTLRHGWANHLANERGLPLSQLQALGGWSRLDSTAGYTPIMIRYNGILNILPIEDIWNIIKEPIEKENKREFKNIKQELKVLIGENNWSQIYQISRHNFNRDLLRINTSGGLIDISKNHSMISINGRILDANKLKVGDKISILKPRPLKWNWGLKDSNDFGFIGTKELAWLYGLFVAEGCRSKGEVAWCNNDLNILNKCEKIIKENFHKKSFISKGKDKRISLCDRRLESFFKREFYTSTGYKKIPTFILNSNLQIKKSFLDGYNEGDGYTKNKKGYFVFTSNSQTLMSGLLFLISQVTNQDYNLFCRDDKENIVSCHFSKKKKLDHREIKKIREINYNGKVYDLSTVNEKFCAGIGYVRVHNTVGIYTKANPKKAVEAAYESF